MDIATYLKHINDKGPLKADKATLDRLMANHLAAITFENIDQQLGTPVSLDVKETYEKIVVNKRGGWCFEVNNLFGWALREIGFEVKFLAGYVDEDHPEKGDASTHMFLRVNCDEPLMVDVGFGGGQLSAIPIKQTSSSQAPYTITMSHQDNNRWQYLETSHGTTSSFNFSLQAVEIDFFNDVHQYLQTNSASSFVRTLTAQRRLKNKHIVLRGRVMSTFTKNEKHKLLINSATELQERLNRDFNLDIPQIADIWPKILNRHQQLFG